MLLKKQACRRRYRNSKRNTCQGEGGTFFFFLFTWMACASLHRVQATLSVFPLSFLSLFCLSQCEGVSGCGGLASGSVEAGWGYLWFISGHSSKKPVDAASLSHPLCPSHCFSIGLPLCPWHTGKRCPALPMLPS